MGLDDGWMTGVLLLPEPPFLWHLLVQVPLLAFFPRHSFIVGRQSKDGPGPLIWTERGQSEGPQRRRWQPPRLTPPVLLMSFSDRSLLERDSLGCLYRYMTARPMPLCFSVSWLTLGSCRDQEEQLESA